MARAFGTRTSHTSGITVGTHGGRIGVGHYSGGSVEQSDLAKKLSVENLQEERNNKYWSAAGAVAVLVAALVFIFGDTSRGRMITNEAGTTIGIMLVIAIV